MKKLFLAVVFGMSLVSCGGGGNAETDASPKPSPAPAPAKMEIPSSVEVTIKWSTISVRLRFTKGKR